MNRSPGPDAAEIPDWDVLYRQGTPPWETGRPAGEAFQQGVHGAVHDAGTADRNPGGRPAR